MSVRVKADATRRTILLSSPTVGIQEASFKEDGPLEGHVRGGRSCA